MTALDALREYVFKFRTAERKPIPTTEARRRYIAANAALADLDALVEAAQDVCQTTDFTGHGERALTRLDAALARVLGETSRS